MIGAAAAGALYYAYPVQVSTLAGLTRNYLISWFAPPGTTTTELNAAYQGAGAAAPSPPAEAPLPSASAEDWPSYNRTLTSERYSQLSQINTKNVGQLKVLCTYDVDQFAAFESGLIMVDNALIGTTEFDIFSLDPATCAENWRTHEDYPPSLLPANRGAAYMDGMLFRGTQDGRVLAYDFKTGKRMWEATIADAETWRVGAVGPDCLGRPRLRRQCGRRLQGWQGAHVRARREDRQDRLGVLSGSQSRGRRDPRTARRDAAQHVDVAKCARHTDQRRRDLDVIHPRSEDRAAVRPRRQSGSRLRDRRARGRESLYRLGHRARRQDRDYKHHFKIVPKDWHDWDVSNPPVLIQTMGGKQLMVVAPKDGHLYGFDLATNSLLYRVPVTRVEDVAATFSPGKAVHFCPGSVGARNGTARPTIRRRTLSSWARSSGATR